LTDNFVEISYFTYIIVIIMDQPYGKSDLWVDAVASLFYVECWPFGAEQQGRMPGP
jgi:hypothetical protein